MKAQTIDNTVRQIKRVKKAVAKSLNKKEQKKLIEVLEQELAPCELATTPNPKRREIVRKHVEKFEADGGVIQKLKPGVAMKVKASARGAEKNSIRKGKKIRKAKGEGAARASDAVTLSSLLVELKIEGVVARKALRTSEIVKPGKQWAWEKTDTKAIAEVTKFLKGLK